MTEDTVKCNAILDISWKSVILKNENSWKIESAFFIRFFFDDLGLPCYAGSDSTDIEAMKICVRCAILRNFALKIGCVIDLKTSAKILVNKQNWQIS